MGILARDLERLTVGMAALRIVRQCIREGADVGKLSSIAERIRDTKTRLDVEADKLALRLDDIDAAAPKAFDRGHAFLTAQASEVAEIEDTLRELSNLPLGELPASQIDLPATPTDTNAARRAAAGLAPLTATETLTQTLYADGGAPIEPMVKADAPADQTRRLPRAWADS